LFEGGVVAGGVESRESREQGLITCSDHASIDIRLAITRGSSIASLETPQPQRPETPSKPETLNQGTKQPVNLNKKSGHFCMHFLTFAKLRAFFQAITDMKTLGLETAAEAKILKEFLKPE
jgi:hypothetical protein